MTLATADVATQQLSLPEELLLMLLNEESGYFHQVPGWALNCAVVGAVLAELSLLHRIDTDMASLIPLDRTATGDPALDPILEEIHDEPAQRNAQYWIERLAPRAESIIDLALARLVDLQILEHHDGDFWTLARTAWQMEASGSDRRSTAAEFVRTRIRRVIFSDRIPEARDAIIVGLINTCDVFRFMFTLDEESEERIEVICRMDLIGRAIAEAVSQNLAGPLLRRSSLRKDIPTVSLLRLLRNPHLRDGNVPALFADLANEYGPVYQIKPPFMDPMLVLAGPETNRWAHKQGRMYLRTKDYLADFEKVYRANGILPALDGADHFRFRKSMQSAYSRGRLEGVLDDVYRHAREHMAEWTVGEAIPASRMCRRLINAQLSPITISVDSQDLIDDLVSFKTRALSTHVVKVMPKFMLKTPGMRRKAKSIDTLLNRVQGGHTAAQRAGCPRDWADDFLSLHTSDPQFLPESNLRFVLSAPLIASVYLGDMLSCAVYAMASQPELHERIRAEADALFDNGDPDGDSLSHESIDVTRRFIMECLRMYPIVPMSVRNVMNGCIVEDHEIPEGSRIFIAQAATHYMERVFPDPYTFDIDRYLPGRDEHLSPGYAPFGLGTHTCLGNRWMELHLAVNVMLLAHHFTVEVSPENYKLKISPFPSLHPSKKLKFRIAAQRRDLQV